MVRRGEALVVADHVPERDPVPAHQPYCQRERRLQLPRVVEDRGVARPDVLDPDRRPVQPHRVPAADAERHELVDRPVRVDDEVRARAGQLVSSGSGMSAANVFQVAEKLSFAVKCSTITCGEASRQPAFP